MNAQTYWYVINIQISSNMKLSLSHAYTGWRQITRYFIFIGHFPQRSPVVSGSFAKNDLQLKASYDSTPPCIKYMYMSVDRYTY